VKENDLKDKKPKPTDDLDRIIGEIADSEKDIEAECDFLKNELADLRPDDELPPSQTKK
jgi:hypothetical protein